MADPGRLKARGQECPRHPADLPIQTAAPVKRPLLRRCGCAESVERPDVLDFVVAEDVKIAVVGANAKVDGVRLVPLVIDGDDVEIPAANREANRPLVGAVARVALHLDGTHEFMVRRKQKERRAALQRWAAATARRAPVPWPPAPLPVDFPSEPAVAATALYAAPTITTSATKYIQTIKPMTAAMLP